MEEYAAICCLLGLEAFSVQTILDEAGSVGCQR